VDRRILIGAVLTLIIAVSVPVYWTRESTRQRGVEAELETKSLEEGAALYIANCASCHGDFGEGTVDGLPLRGTVLEIADIERATAEGTQAFPSTTHVYAREAGGPLSVSEISNIAFFIKNWDSQVLADVRAEPRQIDIEVYEFGYDPAQITVEVGKPVRLTLVNEGEFRHTWLLEGAEVEIPDEGKTDSISLDLKQGVPATVEFTPLEKGTMSFRCTLPGHAEKGEVGTLVIAD
jgi:plastocyanin